MAVPTDDRGEPGGGPYRDALAGAAWRLGRLASTVLFYPTVASTNDIAARLTRDREPGRDSEGTVIVAEEQTAGRGRRGHTWISPAGAGLYVSVVLMPSRAERDARRAIGLLTLAAGVAISEAVESAAGLATRLKWPNDVQAGGRKLAGILAEAVTETSAAAPPIVLGYGINVLACEWPAEVAQRATSIETEIGRTIGRDRVLVESLAALARRYDDLLAGRFDAILDAWRQRAPSATGARVRWVDGSGEHAGVTAGIDDHGALLVRVGQDLTRIVGGELLWEFSPGD